MTWTFFQRAQKRRRDARCARLDHYWTDEPVLDADKKPTGRIVVRCTNCLAAYTKLEETNG